MYKCITIIYHNYPLWIVPTYHLRLPGCNRVARPDQTSLHILRGSITV